MRTIAHVKRIPKSAGAPFYERDRLKEYVEEPCLPAIEHLWDLNVHTLSSTANPVNIGGKAGIAIEYDTLSPENKRIADRIGTVYEGRADIVEINTPIPDEHTRVDVIAAQLLALARQFKKQPLLWGYSDGLKLAQSYGANEVTQEFIDSMESGMGLVWDEKEGWFWNSKELAAKAGFKF